MRNDSWERETSHNRLIYGHINRTIVVCWAACARAMTYFGHWFNKRRTQQKQTSSTGNLMIAKKAHEHTYTHGQCED